MDTVTLSPKYQVVIPEAIRAELGLQPGMHFHVMKLRDRIEFIPIQTVKAFRGYLKGINTGIDREDDRI